MLDALLLPFRAYGRFLANHRKVVAEAKELGICYACEEEPCEDDGLCNRCYMLERSTP